MKPRVARSSSISGSMWRWKSCSRPSPWGSSLSKAFCNPCRCSTLLGGTSQGHKENVWMAASGGRHAFAITALLSIVRRHNEPILGVIYPVVRAGEAIASDSKAVKLEVVFVPQAHFLQYPSRGLIVYQGCRHDALQ